MVAGKGFDPPTSGNEADWITQIEIELRIMDGWDVANGEEAVPLEPDLEDHDEQAYQQSLRDLREFNTKNRMKLGLFSRSLAMRTDTIRKARELAQFDGNSTQAWTFLKESYLINSASTRLRLRTELHLLRMNGQETLGSYKDRIVVLNSKYQSVNKNVGFGDEELISTLLNGLDQRFENIVNVIKQSDANALTWNEIVRRLRNFENLNNNQHQPKNNNNSKPVNTKEESSTPLLMTREQWRNSESKSNFSNQRNNKNSNNGPKIKNFGSRNNQKWCSFHRVNSHNDSECFDLNNQQRKPNNARNNILRQNNAISDHYDTCLIVKNYSDPTYAKKQLKTHCNLFYIDSAASKSYASDL